jgi:hypothetical protein
MTGVIELGDNYTVEEDNNGDFVITDADGTAVLTLDNSADTVTLNDPILDLVIQDSLTDAAGVSHSGELADVSDLNDDHGNLSGLGDDDHTQYLLVDGSRSMSGSLNLGDNALENAGSIDNEDYNESVNTQTATSGTVTIDLSVANMHEVEADGDITIEFSNVTSTPEGNSLLLRIFDDDTTGPHTITWPASVEWSQGTVRDTVDSDGELEISLRSYDGGTTWKASRSGENFN